jgi:hypothetical protein
MVEGAALLRGTFWGFVSVGFSWMKLFFRPDDGNWKSDLEILNPEQRKIAYRCPHCSSLFIDERPWIPVPPKRHSSPN